MNHYPLPPFDSACHKIGNVCKHHPEGEGRRYLRNGVCVLCFRETRRKSNARTRAERRGNPERRYQMLVAKDEAVLMLKGLVQYLAVVKSEEGEALKQRLKAWLTDLEQRQEGVSPPDGAE